MGTEPVTREIYGARTMRELVRGVPPPSTPDCRQITWRTDPEGDSAEFDLIDDSYSQERLLRHQAFEQFFVKAEEIIRQNKPKAWARYLRVLQWKAEGYTTREIANKEKVSPCRAGALVTKLRQCLRENSSDGGLQNWLISV
jgi:hypothetical protein